MAVYKVPQDVEAEDKLIGPFTFRQFIYLIVVAIGLFLAWILGQVFIGLILIPLPFIIFFGVLALPLRKDQPMEVYLTAVIKFFLKPRIRLWKPDGTLTMVTIAAPQVVEQQLTKSFTGDEAQQRLSYLAQVVDSQGWYTKGVAGMPTSLTDTVAAEAQSAEDILDTSTSVAQSFDNLISRQDAQRKQQMVQQLRQVSQQPTTDPTLQPDTASASAPLVAQFDYNPYPSSMRQKVLRPISDTPQPQQEPSTTQPTAAVSHPVSEPPKEPVTPQVSPDIMRLANNNDLSISALAREANRLKDKDDNEVVVSLR